MEGELVTLSVELDNRSQVDIPGSEAEIVVLWADGEGARPRLKAPIEPVHPGKQETIGPFETPVGKPGSPGYTFSGDLAYNHAPFFQDVHGQALVYNQQQNWIPVGKFRTSTRVRLYRQTGIALGIVAIVVAIILGVISLMA